MNKRHQQATQRFRLIKSFLERETPPVIVATVAPQLTELTGVIDRLSTLSVSQDTGRRLGKLATDQKAVVVRDLRSTFMRPVARLASTLFPDDLNLRRALALPGPKADAAALVSAARSMADTAEPHTDRFVAAGMVPDFVTKLRDAASAAESRLDERRAQVGRHSSATKGITQEVVRGREIVSVLDAVVRPALRGDQRLAEWASLTRVPRRSVAAPAPGSGGGAGAGSGAPGTPGATGPAGTTTTPGTPGVTGTTGTTVAAGTPGATGTTGSSSTAVSPATPVVQAA